MIGGPYVWLVATIAFMAALAGAGYKGYSLGASSVQAAWERAIIEARDAADAQRRQDQAKAAALSKRYEAKVATQRQVSATLAEQLDAALKSKPLPVECRIDSGMLNNINASLAGKGAAGAELPASSGTTAAAKDRPDGGNR